MTISDGTGRRVLVALKEHGSKAATERVTSWIGIPTPLLQELVHSDLPKATAVIMVIDKWTGDLLAIPFTRLLDMFKQRERARGEGELGNISFHIRRDSPGYLIQTPTDSLKMPVDHVNSLDPIFNAFA